MAAAQVLNSPELLSLILQCFQQQTDDERFYENCLTRSTLAKAARVNPMWFELATRELWSYEREEGPSLKDLLKIQRTRRQLYASRIISMDVPRESQHTRRIAALEFPRLKNLSASCVGTRDGPSATTVKQRLCATVESVSLCSWADGFDKDLLRTLNSRCPQLRSITLENINTAESDLSPKDLNDFFGKLSLESVITDIQPPLMNGNLLLTFGRMENLKMLFITTELSMEQIPTGLLVEDYTFFPNLDSADLILDREAVELAFLAFRTASSINFCIECEPDEKMPMFTHLKQMKNLKELVIELAGEETCLHANDLYCLNTLNQLKTLRIGPTELDYDVFVEFDGEESELDLQFVFSGLSRLKHLDWQVPSGDVSAETLSLLSRCCPKLKDINLFKS